MALLEWEPPRGLKSKKLPNEPKHPSPDVSWTWGDGGVACKRLVVVVVVVVDHTLFCILLRPNHSPSPLKA